MGSRGPQAGTEKAKAGGRAVAEKYGREFYSRIGQRGGSSTRSQRGLRHYQQMGAKGGSITLSRHGRDFYSEIGRKGGSAGKGVPRSPATRREPSVHEVETTGITGTGTGTGTEEE